MQTKRLSFNLRSLLAIVALTAFNFWLFSAVWKMSYLDWYMKNGSQIALSYALVTLVWDINRATGLVSAEPRHYLGTCLQLPGLVFYSLGSQMRRNGEKRVSSSLVDVLITAVIAVIMALLVLAWLVFVAPIQYFFFLVVGAPARVVLASPENIYAGYDEDGRLDTKPVPIEDRETGKKLKDAGWFDASFSGKAVTLTNALLALALYALNNLPVK